MGVRRRWRSAAAPSTAGGGKAAAEQCGYLGGAASGPSSFGASRCAGRLDWGAGSWSGPCLYSTGMSCEAEVTQENYFRAL
mmetsp:Transcript_8445/g.18147  ORF Transcript_8445/g.18147 Transcript_8445/m.18147 type:complete len:81 (+) Transcript_8445:92-334(+)